MSLAPDTDVPSVMAPPLNSLLLDGGERVTFWPLAPPFQQLNGPAMNSASFWPYNLLCLRLFNLFPCSAQSSKVKQPLVYPLKVAAISSPMLTLSESWEAARQSYPQNCCERMAQTPTPLYSSTMITHLAGRGFFPQSASSGVNIP